MSAANWYTMTVQAPMAVDPMLAILEAHAIPGIEQVDRERAIYERVLRHGSRGHVLTVRLHPTRVRMQLDGSGEIEPNVVDRVRRWLDLDADIEAIADRLGSDPRLGPLVRETPGLRLLGSLDPFETTVMTVVGQQVSLAAARTFGSRLVRSLGEPVGDRFAFPTPVLLAGQTEAELQRIIGVTNARARTIRGVAQAFADGFSFTSFESHREARAGLLALPGIGPWTADYVSLRVQGDPDAFPAEDLALRNALGGVTAKEARALAEHWRPFRAYALFHLWNDYVFLRRPAIAAPQSGA